MSVTLKIQHDEVYPESYELPPGSTVIVRRRAEGTDVVVLPPKPDAEEAAPSNSAVPLTAEQIVRGLGFLAAQHLNASRDSRDGLNLGQFTLELAEAMGVPLPVVDAGTRHRRLAPFSLETAKSQPKPASDQPAPGGEHAASL